MSDFIDHDDPVHAPRVLDAADLVSVTWRKVRVHLERQRESMRAQNDNINLDAIATAALRGRLACITNLLELGNPALTDAADDVAI